MTFRKASGIIVEHRFLRGKINEKNDLHFDPYLRADTPAVLRGKR